MQTGAVSLARAGKAHQRPPLRPEPLEVRLGQREVRERRSPFATSSAASPHRCRALPGTVLTEQRDERGPIPPRKRPPFPPCPFQPAHRFHPADIVRLPSGAKSEKSGSKYTKIGPSRVPARDLLPQRTRQNPCTLRRAERISQLWDIVHSSPTKGIARGRRWLRDRLRSRLHKEGGTHAGIQRYQQHQKWLF